MKEIKELGEMLIKFGIIAFVCLAILIVWAVNRISGSMTLSVSTPPATVTQSDAHDTIIPLPDNRIGIVDGDPVLSGPFKQTIVIFQFDSKNDTYQLVGHFNYSDYMQNPTKYGLIDQTH